MNIIIVIVFKYRSRHFHVGDEESLVQLSLALKHGQKFFRNRG